MTTMELVSENLSEFFVKEKFYDEVNENAKSIAGAQIKQLDFTSPTPKCGEVLVACTGKFTFVCSSCNRKFDVLEQFGEHIRGRHMQAKCQDDAVKLEDDHQDPLNTNAVEINGIPVFPNPIDEDGERSSDESNFDKDMSAEEDNSSSHRQEIIPEDTQNEEKIDSALQNLGYKKHFCDVCGRGYVHRRSYQAHIKKAHIEGTKPLKLLWDIPALNVPLSENTCKYCDEQFGDVDSLQVHLNTHTGRKRFVCRYCLKTFSCRTTRLQHLSTHTGERHYKCPHCPKTFSGKSNLTSHIRAHLKIKNYSCDYCDKRFVQSSEKKVHELTHTGEKPHQCEECGQRYPTSNKLNEHLRRHKNIKNYKCEICGKAFYGLNLLKNHMPTHTGEKPFSCNICGQTFPRKKSLKTHKQLHSGEKNYVCNKCGKAFAQFAGLYSHMKTHGEKPR